MNPVRPTKKMKARSGLSRAIHLREDAERAASISASSLNAAIKELKHARAVERLAIADARQEGIIS